MESESFLDTPVPFTQTSRKSSLQEYGQNNPKKESAIYGLFHNFYPFVQTNNQRSPSMEGVSLKSEKTPWTLKPDWVSQDCKAL